MSVEEAYRQRRGRRWSWRTFSVWLKQTGAVLGVWGMLESGAFHGALAASDIWSSHQGLRTPGVYETRPWALDPATRLPAEAIISAADYKIGQRWGWKAKWGLRVVRAVLVGRAIRSNLRKN